MAKGSQRARLDLAVMSDRPTMLLSCSHSSITSVRRGNGNRSVLTMRRSQMRVSRSSFRAIPSLWMKSYLLSAAHASA